MSIPIIIYITGGVAICVWSTINARANYKKKHPVKQKDAFNNALYEIFRWIFILLFWPIMILFLLIAKIFEEKIEENPFARKKYKKELALEQERKNAFLKDRLVEQLPIPEYAKEFKQESGVAFFIDTTQCTGTTTRINSLSDKIKFKLKHKQWVFFHPNAYSCNLSAREIGYLVPFYKDVAPQSKAGLNNSQLILDYLGYRGNFKTGFLLKSPDKLHFFSIREDEDTSNFASEFCDVISNHKIAFYGAFGLDILLLPMGLSKMAEKDLQEIYRKVWQLKTSGEYYLVQPVLEKIISEFNQPVVSPMVIDSEFRIYLPAYNNMEIKMSHLTKAIYFLFLLHPKGIRFEYFSNHEEELFEIYKTISNKISMTDMDKTIKRLSSRRGSEILVHISRIKAAFLRKFDERFAAQYYVDGERGGIKKIQLNRELVEWKIMLFQKQLNI